MQIGRMPYSLCRANMVQCSPLPKYKLQNAFVQSGFPAFWISPLNTLWGGDYRNPQQGAYTLAYLSNTSKHRLRNQKNRMCI